MMYGGADGKRIVGSESAIHIGVQGGGSATGWVGWRQPGSQAAKRLGIPDSSIWNWIRLQRQGKLKGCPAGGAPVKRSAGELEAELSRLRRALADAKLDNEILKKAAAYFARESR